MAIGANSMVVKNIPDNTTFAGIPAKLISEIGSDGYIIDEMTNYLTEKEFKDKSKNFSMV